MAYIPDEAVMAQRYISDAAFSLYAYYCMRRNRTSGGWNVSASLACTELGISRAAFYRLKSELVEKGWVEAQRNFIKPLFGFDREEVSKLRPESLKTETDVKDEVRGSSLCRQKSLISPF